MALVLWAASASAVSMQISEGEIKGKTTLAVAADRQVNGKAQRILVDSAGLALYTFAVDKTNVSNCSGNCLNTWPPQIVPANVKVLPPFGTIQGNNRQLQLTLKGMPLYHYDDDKRPGDVFGQYPQWDTFIITK